MRSVVGEIDQSLKALGFHFKGINERTRVYVHSTGVEFTFTPSLWAEADLHKSVVESARRTLGKKKALSTEAKKQKSLHHKKRHEEIHKVVPAWERLQQQGRRLGIKLTRAQCSGLIARTGGDYRLAKRALTKMVTLAIEREKRERQANSTSLSAAA